MPYNFDLTMSATISSKVAEEMIKKIVEDQTGKKISKIEARVKSVTKGVGPAESSEIVFDGYSIYFINESSIKPKIDNRFVQQKYE